MQRRILVVALTAVALAVTLLGAPLAFVQWRYLRTQQLSELITAAAYTAVSVPRDLTSDEKPEIDGNVGDIRVAVYGTGGTLLAGSGPGQADDIVVEAARHQHPTDGWTRDELVAAIPVLRGDEVVAVVRASSSKSSIEVHEWLTAAAVGGAAAFAGLMAMLLALRLAWRLATPITELTDAAEELGDGNFAVRAPASGIPELDAVATSMNTTAQRLGQLVDRERAFVSHASHQLRTPLTALRLRLDSALTAGPDELAPATRDAMALVDDLESTVEDLLAVSRGRTSAKTVLDLDRLLAGAIQRWDGLLGSAGRRLVVRRDDPPDGVGHAATVRQVLDVLLDNAYRHGGGTVSVIARDASGALALDVVDEGRPDDAPAVPARRDPGRRVGSGIGLDLARSLMTADGGRLLLTTEPGRTCATVLLPPATGESGGKNPS